MSDNDGTDVRPVQINAYDGRSPRVESSLSKARTRWILQNSPPEIRPFLAPSPPDLRNWMDEEVGWGLVMADDTSRSPEELSVAADAPAAIQELVRKRHAPVFRFRPGKNAFRYLRDFKNRCDVSIASSPFGARPGCLPYYLLLYGDPQQLPWTLQYVLNAERAVGRLHLQGANLERYVDRLLTEWQRPAQLPLNTVVWSTNHGDSDITNLISNLIARPLNEKFASDADSDVVVARYHARDEATNVQLASSLSELQPRMIVTTSHGCTYPYDDPTMMKGTLGTPVDQNLQTLDLQSLLSEWDPDGAIWYSHACCSAGSDSFTLFEGLIEKGSTISLILDGVAKSGPMVAPLPTALLSASKPLKAYIGHIEPTFDWTLRDPMIKQNFGLPVVRALYDNAFSHMPIGHALRTIYQRLAGLFSGYAENLRTYNEGGSMAPAMLQDLLVARDVQSMVILGDPTVSL